jgi:dTDP-4-dehydrorhamnose 3,5-epimerase-like enzyme
MNTHTRRPVAVEDNHGFCMMGSKLFDPGEEEFDILGYHFAQLRIEVEWLVFKLLVSQRDKERSIPPKESDPYALRS